MSRILIPHCEWCKKIVEQSALRVSREDYELCEPCYQEERKQDEKEYNELHELDE